MAAALLPAGLAALALAGCGSEEPEELLRFIADDPDRVLALDEIFQPEVVYDWTLPGATESSGPDPNLPLLDRSVDFDAAQVHSIEATVEAMPEGTLALRWRTAEHPFSKQRQIQLQAEHLGPGSARRFVFDVGSHPLWHGTIVGLRLYTDQRLRSIVAPTRTRVLRRQVEPQRLAEALERPWKARLGRELRSVLLASPEAPISRRLTVAPRSTLFLGFGLQGGVRQPVEFEVSVRRGGHAEEVLFARRLDGSDPLQRERWQEAEVDLSALAGETIELTLSTRGPRRQELAAGFPLWANPEVVSGSLGERLPSVILISVDTLRADHLSLYGYPRPTSPELDAWARRRAVVFRRAVSQAPSTLPSHVSLFTGLDAFRHGVNHDPAPASLVTLAEVLRARGLHTLATTGGGFMHPAYGFLQGFDRYRYWIWGHERLAELPDGIANALSWLRRYRQRPFFLFFHTYEVHAPYRARQPFFGELTGAPEAPQELLWLVASEPTAAEGFRARRGTDYRFQPAEAGSDPTGHGTPQQAIDLYDSAIRYVDQQLGLLLGELERLGLAERTAVVVTSDHGEAFGEHGLAGHGYLYDDNLLVPLIVALPGARHAGRLIERQVRSIDILPTLLELLDLELAANIDGKSLLPLLEHQSTPFPAEAFSYAANDNFGASLRLEDRIKYIFNDAVWDPTFGRDELYRLLDDPGEQIDLAAIDPEREALRRRLVETLAGGRRGLMLSLANSEPRTLGGSLAGELVGPTRIKAWDLPCRCLSWQADGSLAFRLPPGAGLTLAIETDPAAAGVLRLALETDSGAPGPGVEHQVVAEELRGILGVELVDGGWEVTLDGVDELVTGARIWWGGGDPAESGSLAHAEAELRRQMQALGYLR